MHQEEKDAEVIRLELSLNVIGERLGLDYSCIRIANRVARKFTSVRMYDKKLNIHRPGTLYIADPEEIEARSISSAQWGFALTSMPTSSMGTCDYLYMDLPISKTELLSQILVIYENVTDWVIRFQNQLIENSDIGWLAEAIPELIQHPFYIADTSFKVLVFSNHPEMKQISVSWRYFWQYKYLPLDLVERLRACGDVDRMKNFTSATFYRSVNFNHPFITYTLRSNEQVIGFLFVIGMYQNVIKGDIELTDLVGDLINRYMGSSELYTRTIGLVYEGFFRDILRGALTNEDLIRTQLHAFNWKEQDVYCILRTEMDADDFRRQQCFAEDLSGLVDSRSVYHDDAMISILHLPDMAMYVPVCARIGQYARRTHCKSTISEAFRGFTRLPDFYYQVIFCPKKKETEEALCRFRCHMAEYLFENVAHPGTQSTFCVQNLFDIQAYDQKNGTEFFRTLEAYLCHERRLVDTAQSLYIHRNTLIHRLEKIAQLFGDLELDNDKIRLSFQISFKILSVLAEE